MTCINTRKTERHQNGRQHHNEETAMIKEVYGDILLSKAGAVAHGVAPNDDFGQGLALSLREKWPALYKDFRHYCQTDHPKSGEIWTWVGADNRRIVCLMTQEAAYDKGDKPGKATTQYVDHALKALRHLIEQEQIKSVALPRLATGVGDLEWRDVKPLIVKHLGDLQIPVYLYTIYSKNMAAVED